MSEVVRFDAELVVHRAETPVGCGAGVLVAVDDNPWPYASRYSRPRPNVGTVRRVVRCHLPRGHDGDHTADDQHGQTHRAVLTACQQRITDGAWIDWTPNPDDPRCPTCYGIPADEQEALL